MSDHGSTQELIQKIEKKDRRFRFFQSSFVLLLMIGLTTVIYIQFQLLDTVKMQLRQDASTAKETREARDKQLGRVERRLNCIVLYFTQQNRTTITIEDIDKCTLSREALSALTINNAIVSSDPQSAQTIAVMNPNDQLSQTITRQPTTSAPPSSSPTEPTQPRITQQLLNRVNQTTAGVESLLPGILNR